VTSSPGSGGPEAIVVSSPSLSPPLDFAQVIILWFVQLLAGNTAATYKFRLRRGTAITGTQINVDVVTNGPPVSTGAIYSGVYVDVPGAVANLQYSLGMLCAGGGTNAVINDVCMYAFAL